MWGRSWETEALAGKGGIKAEKAQFLWRKKGMILQLLKENAVLLQPFLGQMIYKRSQEDICFCILDNKSNASQGLSIS